MSRHGINKSTGYILSWARSCVGWASLNERHEPHEWLDSHSIGLRSLHIRNCFIIPEQHELAHAIDDLRCRVVVVSGLLAGITCQVAGSLSIDLP